MATHLPQLRQLRDPQSRSVQKNPSARQSTPRKTACQGCHARKKRCITAPAQYRCVNCSREGRNCVPRKTSARPTRKQRDIPSLNAFNIPLPHGIDHEVPRWSAMYSMFSEMMRLIPPERAAIDSGGGDDSATRYEEEEDEEEEEERIKMEGHTSEQYSWPSSPGEEKITHDHMDVQAEGNEEAWDVSAPKSTMSAVINREEDVSRQGTGHPAFSLGDLDALLRF